MNYVFFAFLSAFFAGLTSILAKFGMKNINSNLATALRCVVIVIFSWTMALITTDISSVLFISYKTLLFLVLSGISTAASWICFFHALKIGNVNVVVPIDKFSIVLTIILCSVIFPDERLTIFKGICIVLIALGTFLMLEKKRSKSSKKRKSAVLYASSAPCLLH